MDKKQILTNRNVKLIAMLAMIVVPLLIGVTGVMAADSEVVINTGDLLTSGSFGNRISGIRSMIVFAFNTLRYFGWAGVIVGIGFAIFGLIYKLFSEDNEKVMETVQGYITRAVVIVLVGVLMLSAGFLVKIVSELFGLTLDIDPDTGMNPVGTT